MRKNNTVNPTPPHSNRNAKHAHHSRYHNKRPPFTPDPEHWTRKGQHGWKAKLAYPTEDDAWEWLHQNPRLQAEGYTAYQCHVCQKWHIGRKRNNK